MKPAVAVIGGGWAGCTAALTVAEAGVAVTLYEASRTLGGRARSVELEGRSLDNGQHILLGAYEQTLQLIERLHPATTQHGLWRLPLTLKQPPDFSFACPPLPAPLHLLAGLLTARGLNWGEKLAAARWAHALLNKTDSLDHLSVSQLTRSQPEKLCRLLWHPLCVSALNTPPQTASARVFRDVVCAAFGGRRHHSDLLLPRRDLTALLPAPAAARLVELGGELRMACRVTALDAAADGITLTTHDGSAVYSHIVVAVAPQHLAALAAPVAALQSLAGEVGAYRYQPIATGYVQYDTAFRLAAPLFALAGGPAQFVFDRGQSHGQAGLLAFVASAAANLSADWLDEAEIQLQRFAEPGPARWRRRIIEKNATYACVPGLARPAVCTAHPRIFLAGDYTAGPYPATLESATQSGVQSAGALLEKL
ncbi:MAG: hydroxysqualene dehydroxylase HpnE [Thiobacillus sp.]|jgi:squalene-associated FAD-dependent desaturase|uniref:hydroxysqualene dehydroxylase HpnE n=1 Tax=Thiobacillus sp. TaxID=924 RepID=UPI0028955280|nr:hydroxysqualene dehydroxylase HpnE [Thiobacillus sp.]MDT3708280.1 hydroxysqualene dehydroxylase HpnE [Thiobacillus sp.]